MKLEVSNSVSSWHAYWFVAQEKNAYWLLANQSDPRIVTELFLMCHIVTNGKNLRWAAQLFKMTAGVIILRYMVVIMYNNAAQYPSLNQVLRLVESEQSDGNVTNMPYIGANIRPD